LEPSVYWPEALKDGQPVNLRRLIGDHDPEVVSFIIEDDYGWVSSDYHGVEKITYQAGRLTLHERGTGPERDLAMTVGDLFPYKI
jgi:hypothetical protein